jgi:eukaryotic-like serine/threonine-protein kinase
VATRQCYYCNTLVSASARFCPHCNSPLVLQGRYQLVSVLGKGGFGVVYEAIHTGIGRRCAIKVVATTSIHDQQRIEAEAHILGRYAPQFPFIPDIYDVWSEQNQTYLAMEFVDGLTLDQTTIPWAPARVEEFLRTLLGYLAQVHAIGLIHRDLKPQNLKLTPEGRYIMLDFGIAKEGFMTQTAAKMATPDYAPPEQMSRQPTDARSDLYSLAATAYRLLTGRPPPPSAIRLHTGAAPQRPSQLVSGVRPALERSLLWMLELNRDHRPADAQAVLALLDAPPPRTNTRPMSTTPVPVSLASAASKAVPVARATHLPWVLRGTVVGALLVVALVLWRVASIGTLQQPSSGDETQPSTVLASSAQLPEPTSLPTQVNTPSQSSQDGQPSLVCEGTLEDHDTRAVAFSPTNLRIATVGTNMYLYLWDITKCSPSDIPNISSSNPKQKSILTSVVWSPDSRLLATGEDSGMVRIWNADPLTVTTSYNQEQGEQSHYVLSVDWSPDGSHLASTGENNRVIVATIKDGKVEGNPVPIRTNLKGFSVAWQPSPGTLLAVSSVGRFWIIDPKKNIPDPTQLPDDGVDLEDMVWSPNGKCLAAAGADTIYIWPVDHWENRRELPGGGHIIDLAWSPNGRWLASAAFGRPAVIWDVASEKRLFEFSADGDYPLRVAWSSDSKQFVTVGNFKIQLWDVSGVGKTDTTSPAPITITPTSEATSGCVSVIP